MTHLRGKTGESVFLLFIHEHDFLRVLRDMTSFKCSGYRLNKKVEKYALLSGYITLDAVQSSPNPLVQHD